jgi:REP element-mobilizing transposase RayT
LLKRPGKMHLFKSREPNLVHYATSVTFNRVPVFRSDDACSLFIDALATTREKEPFKPIGYVVMPDHIHLLANPLNLDISIVVGRLKGRAAVSILGWLRSEGHSASLAKLSIGKAAQVRSNSWCLDERVLGRRYLESQVHPSEASLHSHESCARRPL